MTPLGKSIPGETPIDDLSGLKIKGITTRAELNEHEAANITKAAEKYLVTRPSKRTAKFDFGWCLRLHREMFGKVWDWAGTLRGEELTLGVASHTISERLENLLLDLPVWNASGMEMAEQAARLHHTAVFIHPFKNGNGRWSRMLANIWLKVNRYPLTMWPEEVIGTESTIRAQYLAAIKRADDLEYSDLISMHKQFSE
jgi:Fic-DOC domain mobile mystery protein B